ncbi:hypothetical protein SAMN05443245_5868 [Paraburkholderia fungorum]|uniref:Uncharacterized protein n=1 Tax=Paraburkholderia fungorum TaxID=134537 RepID=A0A1H1IY75_9BURK|nr:hypothetical protein [Paraburkholderia fungorum]SDR42633.1 hypothetical protein SAMN05443245_5868 [Paraburkholderia fungorum]
MSNQDAGIQYRLPLGLIEAQRLIDEAIKHHDDTLPVNSFMCADALRKREALTALTDARLHIRRVLEILYAPDGAEASNTK